MSQLLKLNTNLNNKPRELKMKLINSALFLFISSAPIASYCQTFKSAFGFTSDTSGNWIIVTNKILVNNPNILNFNAEETNNISSSFKKQLKNMALTGKVEILYHKNNNTGTYDNINIFIDQNKPSDINAKAKWLCSILPQQIKQGYKRSDYTKVHFCENKKIYNIDAVSYLVDGPIYGTKAYGYYFNTKNNTITLTLLCKNKTCSKVKKDAELIFKHMKFKQ